MASSVWVFGFERLFSSCAIRSSHHVQSAIRSWRHFADRSFYRIAGMDHTPCRGTSPVHNRSHSFDVCVWLTI